MTSFAGAPRRAGTSDRRQGRRAGRPGPWRASRIGHPDRPRAGARRRTPPRPSTRRVW